MRHSMPIVITLLATLLAPARADQVGEAEALLRQGRTDEAIALLEQAIAAHPAAPLAYVRLGGALVLRQEHGAAIERFRQAIALDPGSATAFVGLAVAYIHLGRYDLARAGLDEAARLDPAKAEEIARLRAWLDGRDERTVRPNPG